jgi:hypothetical protein
MDATTIGVTSTEADATAFLLAEATDLIDFSLDDGSHFNPASTEWQSNSFAAFPTDSETGEIASWDFDDSSIFEQLPADVDDFYETQFGDSDSATAASSQALDAIEATLAAEGSSMRYDKSVYLAFRENALSHRFAAHDIYNAKLGERTVAHVYFVNASDDEGLYHPHMIIVSHYGSGGPNFLIDVARPPGDGAAGTMYEDQTITRRAILENKFVKIPMKDYGLVNDVADNDLAALGLPTLASDEGLAEADWNTLNHAGTASAAVAVDGVVIYPSSNNTLSLATSVAEITTSGIHVGRGLGLHYHADGHGYNGNGINLYNICDYEGHTHPPIIGIAYDGIAIFGKYESAYTMDGEDVALDEFGGHSHGDYGYHYHAHQGTVTQDQGPGPEPDLVYEQHFLFVGA